MASASDGLAATLSSLPDLSINPFASPSQRKFHLQLLLDNKEKQLQQAGALGQRVLAQQIELEEKIHHLQDLDVERGDDEDLDAEARERYRELADTVKAWDLENAQLSNAFGPKVHIFSSFRLRHLLQVISRSCLCASFRASWLPRTMSTCRPRIPAACSSGIHFSLPPTRRCRHTHLFSREMTRPSCGTRSSVYHFHFIFTLILPWLLLVAHSLSPASCRRHAFSCNPSQGSPS